MAKHPGFKAVQKSIAKREGVSQKAAGAILASSSRKASPRREGVQPTAEQGQVGRGKVEKKRTVFSVSDPEVVARFRSKYTEAGADECWIWCGTRRNGYGCLKVNGALVSAHRFAYVLAHGDIPDDLVLDHVRCDVRLCVNPSHLEPKSRWANTLRSATNPVAASARRGHRAVCSKGHDLRGDNGRMVVGSGRLYRRCLECYRERRARWIERRAALGNPVRRSRDGSLVTC